MIQKEKYFEQFQYFKIQYIKKIVLRNVQIF